MRLLRGLVFMDVHLFTPDRFTGGWRALIADLDSVVGAANGLAQVSVQPNAGSQVSWLGCWRSVVTMLQTGIPAAIFV